MLMSIVGDDDIVKSDGILCHEKWNHQTQSKFYKRRFFCLHNFEPNEMSIYSDIFQECNVKCNLILKNKLATSIRKNHKNMSNVESFPILNKYWRVFEKEKNRQNNLQLMSMPSKPLTVIEITLSTNIVQDIRIFLI